MRGKDLDGSAEAATPTPSASEYREIALKACAELIRRNGNIVTQHCRYWYESTPEGRKE